MHPLGRLGVVLVFWPALTFWNQSAFCQEYSTYTAAVIEHVRFGDLVVHSPDEILNKNLEVYVKAVETASANSVDIIVFPEWGLYPHTKSNRSAIFPFVEDIPDPKLASWNPCVQERFQKNKILRTLSCLAQANNIFIVANMVDGKTCHRREEESCDLNDIEGCQDTSQNCPPDGRKLFNTNVVFNRNGSLVSRYYKRHLYFEFDVNLPDEPENSYFETDFGLFTSFVCFDINFKPAVNAIEERKVKNVAYPTYWFDHLPLASAIQLHQAWAIRHNVNLLSSNVHLPGTGTMGSAIYSGSKGALIYTYNPDGRTKLLISQVPRDVETISSSSSFVPETKMFHLKNDKFVKVEAEDSTQFGDQCSRKILGMPKNFQIDYRCFEANVTDKIVFKKLDGPSGQLESCSEGLCCTLEYEALSMDEDYYLASSSSIEIFYETYGFCMENCYLVRCDGLKEKPCNVYPTRTKTVFKRVKLMGNFTTKYVYPSILESGMKLVPTSKWVFEGNGFDYKTQSSDDELLIAALQGRCYDKDPAFPR